MTGDVARRAALKRRALGWLAQREHSRAELRRKLLAVRPVAAEDADITRDHVAAWVDGILDELSADGWLCDARVAESRVHLRSARFGSRRIESELQRLGVSATPQALADLRASEVDRARTVWQKKYGMPATDMAGRARQMRFLAGRGFSTDAIRRVVPGAAALGASGDDPGEDADGGVTPAMPGRAGARRAPPSRSDA